MKSRLGKLIAICLMAGVAVAFAIPVYAQDLPKTHLKVIGPHSKTATWKLNIRPFWEDELPSLSKGAITADLISMTELGLKGPEIFRLIKIGIADIGSTNTGYAAGEVPELDGFDLSGVVQDVATLRKVVAAYLPVIDKIMRERVGVRMLAVWPTVQQSIWCAVPVKGLADMKGKKVRVFATTQADFMKAIGAAPVTMAFSEVVPALQRKVIDCAVTGTLSGNLAKWPEVATHLFPINVGWSLWIMTANEKSWARIDPKVQAFILEKLNSVMIARAWKIAEEGTMQGIWCSTGDKRCTWGDEYQVTKYNSTLVPYTKEDKARLKELVQNNALPQFAKRCGAPCVKAWNETVGKVVGLTAKAP